MKSASIRLTPLRHRFQDLRAFYELHAAFSAHHLQSLELMPLTSVTDCTNADGTAATGAASTNWPGQAASTTRFRLIAGWVDAGVRLHGWWTGQAVETSHALPNASRGPPAHRRAPRRTNLPS